jgi:8-amino-7-oxononanoate synthase
MGTMSKALGLSGGYIAGTSSVIDLLVNRARSFIYSTAPPPGLAHAACAALDLIKGSAGDARRAELMTNVGLLTSRFTGATTDSAIVPVVIGDESQAMKCSERLMEQGFLVPAIRYPTVARGTARLRITLTAAHSPAQIEAMLHALQGARALPPEVATREA